MKNFRLIFAVMLVLVVCQAPAMAFDSMRTFTGQPECERSTFIAADTITAGMLVRPPVTLAQIDARVVGDYDTAAMIIRSQVENDSYVCGVAEWTATPGQTCRVIVHGIANVLVLGADSPTASSWAAGDFISATTTAGYAGSVQTFRPGHDTVPYAAQVEARIGWVEVNVGTSSTAALKRCFINIR